MKGVPVQYGDILETGAGEFVQVELTSAGILAALGSSSRLFILRRGDTVELVLLQGWLKADTHAAGKRLANRFSAPSLGVTSPDGTVLLHSGGGDDELFQESGAGTVVAREGETTAPAKISKANQFFVRQGVGFAVEPRPAPAFVAAMPVQFRDSLIPLAPTSAGIKDAAPRLVRDVTYEDVQPYLTMARDWRRGFVDRFRARLDDPAFRSAVDRNMRLHPEWYPLLHRPDEDLDKALRTEQDKTAH